MAFAENLDEFFDTTDGAAITATIAGASVKAYFGKPSAEALLVAGDQPTLLVKSTDVASTVRGAAVVVSGVSYTVAKIDPDGTGLSRVTLEKA
jgi:hypothetical protein